MQVDLTGNDISKCFSPPVNQDPLIGREFLEKGCNFGEIDFTIRLQRLLSRNVIRSDTAIPTIFYTISEFEGILIFYLGC